MKGVSLPINVLVIVVLALIVLLAILALFYGVWKPEGITLEAAKNNACNMLLSTGCNDPSTIVVRDFDADRNGEANSAGDTLLALCENWYSISDPYDCKKIVCKCE